MSDTSATKTDLQPTMPAGQLLMSSVALEPLFRQRLLDPATAPGDVASIDGFCIIRQIGEGGMGLVFLARSPEGGDEVAVKVISPQLVNDPRLVHRFLNEARHMSRLSHPNILRVLKVCDRPHGPYYVMPYMPHGSLAGMLAPGNPLEKHLILQVAAGLARALAHAHDKGIIHRDLKPANLLMDGEGNAYLSDFGLVRTLFNDSIVDVRASHCEGTVSYMSPAVARGAAEDTRCDIYSFGAILYEMLAGRPPYEGRSSQEVRAKILSGPPIRISKLNPLAQAELAKIAEGAMARELRDRYAKMDDIVADLERVEHGKPPLGPRGHQSFPWHRGLSTQIGVSAALAAIVLGCVLYLAVRLFSHVAADSGERGSATAAMGAADDLYVTSNSDGNILEFNPTSRKFVGVFAIAEPHSKPAGLAFAHNGNLYVNNWREEEKKWHEEENGFLTEYNGATGAFICNVAKTVDPYGMAVDGQNIFVVESLTKQCIHEFAYNGVTGPSFRIPLLQLPLDVAIGPDGNLYVSGRDTSSIVKLQSFGAGAESSQFASFSNVTQSHGLAFGPNHNLFASDIRGNVVIEFDGTTGAPVRTISGGMDGPAGIAFDAASNLWVTNMGGNSLTEYDLKTGQLIHTITGSELNAPMHICRKPTN